MSSSTYTKAQIYDKSFTTIEADTSRIRCEGGRHNKKRKLVNEFMISGPTASVPECAPQERPATFSPGMQEQKPVNSDTWARAGTSITRKIHRLESMFQLIPVCKTSKGEKTLFKYTQLLCNRLHESLHADWWPPW